VEAKRFLCATDSEYAQSLSAGSTASLALQGGPMTAEECTQFLAQPQSADAIRLRRWDDLGKDTENSPSSIDEFAHLLYLFVGELAN
jgi:predicted HD phosphohydrolase